MTNQLEEDPEYLDNCLVEFIKTFEASLDDRTWINLVKEELEEVKAETPGTVEYLKEITDLSYVFVGLGLVAGATLDLLSDDDAVEFEELIAEASKKISTADVLFGKNVLVEAFHRVHLSNMSKVGPDGEVLRREDGKILKGPHYQPPELGDLM